MVDAASTGKFEPVVTSLVLTELVTNLQAKSPPLIPRLTSILDSLNFEIISEANDEVIIEWRDAGFSTDAPILAAAAVAGVDLFCTGDRGIQSRSSFALTKGLRVISPRALLDEIAS